MLTLAKPAAMGLSDDAQQQRWAAKIRVADGYILVSPECNHGPSAVLKNALDYLWAEWGRKPAAFVSSGNVGGVRAIEQLRGIAIELRMAPLGEAVHIFSADESSRRVISPPTAETRNSSRSSSIALHGGAPH